MTKIKILVDDIELQAELNDSPAAQAIARVLPIKSRGSLWGEEIYFSIGAVVDDPNTVSVVQEGDLGFWEPGNAFCIFYGRTPASRGNEIRPASPVNVVGRIAEGWEQLKKLKRGPMVTIEKA